MRQFVVTENMGDKEKREVLDKMSELFSEVSYINEKGERVEVPKDKGRDGPLDAVWPHPILGIVDARSDDPAVFALAVKESGREPTNEKEFVDALTYVSREKGWKPVWVEPEPESPPKRKRGRPKGSKNKKKRRKP